MGEARSGGQWTKAMFMVIPGKASKCLAPRKWWRKGPEDVVTQTIDKILPGGEGEQYGRTRQREGTIKQPQALWCQHRGCQHCPHPGLGAASEGAGDSELQGIVSNWEERAECCSWMVPGQSSVCPTFLLQEAGCPKNPLEQWFFW